jgi:hypothetical protein
MPVCLQAATTENNVNRIRELELRMQVQFNEVLEAKMDEMRLQTKILVESMIEGQTKAEQTKHRERIETRLRVIVFRMQQSLVASAFGTWAHTVTRARRIEAVKHNAALRFKNFMVSSCFATWSETAKEQALRRNEATARDNFIRLVDLEKAFESEVGQRHYEVGQINAVLTHLEGGFTRSEESIALKRNHAIESKLREATYNIVGVAFDAWKAEMRMVARRTVRKLIRSGLKNFGS